MEKMLKTQEIPKRINAHLDCEISAIDATDFRFVGIDSQYSLKRMTREVNKAYVGFYDLNVSQDAQQKSIATGNWGCGIFGGNKAFKSIIQILAASEAGRDLTYFTFGDKDFTLRLKAVCLFLKENKVTVGQLWKYICEYEAWFQNNTSNGDIFNMIDPSAISTGAESTKCLVQ